MTIALPQSDAPRVSIIITSSIRTDLLYSCLQSLVRFGPKDIPCQTIVVLNEADARTEAELREAVRGVEFVRSPVNLGLAGAANLGRSLARGEFLALLHDDAEVLPGWMEALVEAADAHPEAGAIGGMVLNPDGSLQNAGSILWQDAQTSPRLAGDAPAAAAFDRIEAVDYCGTASLLVRTSAWDAIGGTEEQNYPAYYVDVDLCLSLWQAGAAVLCQPKSLIHHHRSASTRSVFRHFVVLRNRVRFKQKWATALQQQEPFDNNAPASIARANARAQTAWERRRAAGLVPKGSPRTFDPVRQRNEHHARAQALQKAYAEHIRNVVEDIEADRAGAHGWAKSLVREKQELTQAHETLALETRKLEQTYNGLVQERQELGRAYDALEREKRELERTHEALALEKHALEQTHDTLSREKQALEQTRDTLLREKQALERALSALLASRSWRITAPLRYLVGLVKRKPQ
jgi:GT2 family glycosyltransferase